MEETTYKVYIETDINNVIIRIESSLSQDIDFSTGWTQIDEGTGDKYAHAQGNYLDEGLVDSNGKHNYKLIDGKLVELTDDEKATLFPTVSTTQPPTNSDLQSQIFNLTTQLVNGGVI